MQNVADDIPENNNADVILTSPPYGDSGTTVAYEQYTSFGFEWTHDLIPDFQTVHDYQKQSLGNSKSVCDSVYEHPSLTETVERIHAVDPKRALEVLQFFNGYQKALTNISRCLHRNAFVCLVVGNRIVKNQQIPMDQITASLLAALGLSFDSISVREISNKVMPLRNSPSNVRGCQSKTMSNEYVVVFKNT